MGKWGEPGRGQGRPLPISCSLDSITTKDSAGSRDGPTQQGALKGLREPPPCQPTSVAAVQLCSAPTFAGRFL
ncbi:hypothetical protein E2320_011549 [Naja naja]|nr:hypothetical protein E2320_011549 [Naja naja]